MAELLKKRGDAAFADSLTLERPEVRSGSQWFSAPQAVGERPKDEQCIIAKAPKIDFPLSQSERDESKSKFLQIFIRYEKEHSDKSLSSTRTL